MEDSDEEVDVAGPSGSEPKLEISKKETAEPESMAVDDTTDEKEEEEVDPSLADWFKVEKEETPGRTDFRQNQDDSETEPDSENEDVKDEDADADDWLDIPSNPVSTPYHIELCC